MPSFVDNQTVSGQHKYSYTYDYVGSRTTMLVTDGSGTKTHVYSYDNIYQLTDVNYPTGYDYLATDTTFNYDPLGNRTTVVDGGGTTTYTTNNLNQYTAVGDVNYLYDDNGNMTYDGANTYTYDARNRLITATRTAGSLAAACDNENLVFTPGGDAEWFAEFDDCRPGGDNDTARSGAISDNEETWLETTVQDEGTLTYWSMISASTGDTRTFYIDGQFMGSQSGIADWAQSGTYTITGLGTHTLRWKYSKDGSGSSGEDCVKVDDVQWNATTEPSSNLQEALDTAWAVTAGGDEKWYKTTWGSYYGGDCARTPALSEGQKTQMQVRFEGTGTISFYWKVSSELNSNWLEFYIDGVRQDRISGEVAWQQKSYTITSGGTHALLWQYVQDVNEASDCAWVDYLQLPGTPPAVLNELSDAVDIPLTFTTGGTGGSGDWTHCVDSPYYDDDCAQCGATVDGEESWMQTTVNVETQTTVSFYWKVSSEEDHDYLEFYIDSNLQGRISGPNDWQPESYTITTAGTHTLKWRYVKDGSGYSGWDRGWVDYVQWSVPLPAPSNWQTITYTYDPAGRRIEKKYDDVTVMRYLYDGAQCIAEYDGSDNLLRRYIFGPGIDEPISMVDVEDSNATYYYHFDGLGSVIALTNSSGSTVELYEYSVYGQVAASDANIPNRFMFTGREFDADTGLYYYRARYYNPEIGRFLQTDPAGDGMNPYAYCVNNPVCVMDPSGLSDVPIVGGGPYSGYELQEVNISGRRLVAWYFIGKGVGLWYKGGHAGELLKEAARMRVHNRLVENEGAFIKGMVYLSNDWGVNSEQGCWAPLGGIDFETSGWAGYADMFRELPIFRPLLGGSDAAIKNFLGGGRLYMDFSWAGEWNDDHTEYKVTIKAYYSFVDTADFHWDPIDAIINGGKWHPEDAIGKWLEWEWNTGGWFPAGSDWVWILYTRFSGRVAQPYNILIQTDVLTTVVVYDARRLQARIVSEWP